jgi:putative hydrolase of the HAD superfamily
LAVQIYRQAGIDADPADIRAAQLAATAQLYGESLTFEASEEADRERETELRRLTLANLGITDEAILRRLMEIEEATFDAPGVSRLYPEVPDVLSTLREAGLRLGIISNWSWNLRKRCDQVGITPYFDHIMGSAYAGCIKPHPCIFEKALAALGVSPQRALHVGDSYEADVVGARAVGMDAVLVDRTDPEQPRDCPVVSDLRQLYPLLGID